MRFLKNFLIAYFLIVLFPICARSVGARPTSAPTQQPASPTAQRVAVKPVAQPQSFNDYMTQIRTVWKSNDVINAQGNFTDKFIDFVLSARLDTFLIRTLLEAGKNLYLQLPIGNEESMNALLAIDETIETVMIGAQYPFYDLKTKIFKQSYVDDLVRVLETGNPNKSILNGFINDRLQQLSDVWQTAQEQDTSDLTRLARQQINSSFEKYGLIGPQPQPVVPPVQQKPAAQQQQPTVQTPTKQTLIALKNNIKKTIDDHFISQKKIYEEEFKKKNTNSISATIQIGFDELYASYGDTLKQMQEDGKDNEVLQCTELMYDTFFDHLTSLDTQFNATIKTLPNILTSKILKLRAIIKPIEQQPKEQPAAPAQPAKPAAKAGVQSVSSSFKIGSTLITIVQGDIIDQKVDAIVNAANEKLDHGAGVAGAISKAAGPQLQAYCDKMPPFSGPGSTKCPTGRAVITPAFNLADKGIKNIIHAVGPFGTNSNKASLLASAYQNSLQVALDNNLKSVAFPAISTNIFGYNIDEATPVALVAVRDFIEQHPNVFTEIRFVLLGDNDFTTYKKWMGEFNK